MAAIIFAKKILSWLGFETSFHKTGLAARTPRNRRKEEPKTLKLYFILCNTISSSTVSILPTVGILPAVSRAEGLLFILMQPVVEKLLVDLRLIDFVDYDFLCFCMNNRRCWTLVYKLRPAAFRSSNVVKVVTLFSS